jgi:hypothetical protein
MALEICPRCRSRAIVSEGYREASLDAFVVRAACTGCGFTWEPRDDDSSGVDRRSLGKDRGRREGMMTT